MTGSEDRGFRSADRGRVGVLEGTLNTSRRLPAEGAGGLRYRLRPSVEAFVDSGGVLSFVRPGRPDLVVLDPDAVDVELVRCLEAGYATVGTLASLLSTGPEQLGDKLSDLLAADLLLVRAGEESGSLDGDDGERFARQLPYLAELGDEIELQRGLRATSVAVVGCGGLGTWSVAALACVGVGRLVLVDDDTVELSNLNRQILYRRDDVGARKVDATARWLRAFDPAIAVAPVARRLAGEEDVRAVLDDVDAVVLAADWPPYELARWVNATCVAREIPCIVAGQAPPLVKIGPMYLAGAGACFACHERALRRESRAYDDYVAFRQATATRASTLGPAAAVAGGLIGLELMHLRAGRRPASCDAAFLLDVGSLELRREPVRRDPHCSVCKHLHPDGGG